jgi:PAS domain S-box-containing protein
MAMNGDAQDLEAFAALYDFLPVGVFRSAPDGRWLGVNRALARLNGYDTPAQYVAAVQDIATECYVRPEDRAEFRRRLEADGEIAGFEVEILRHRSGERIWARVSARVERGAAGEVRHYQGTVEDITEAVQARRALEQREATLREVADRVPGVVYRLQTKNNELQRFDYISDNLTALTGQTPEDLYRNPRAGWALRHPDDAERVAAEIVRTNLSGEPLDVEYRLVLPDGRVKWIHQTSSVAKPFGDGALRYGYLQDITERKQAEAASRRAAEELEQIVALLPGAVFRYVRRPGVDGMGRYSYVSAGLKSLLGMTPAEAMADTMSLIDRIHPEDRARFEADSDRAIAARAPFSTVMRMLVPQPGGGTTQKWVQNESAPAPGADGEEVRVGVLLDVTARHEAETALHRSAVQMQQMIDLLPGVLFRLALPAQAALFPAHYSFISAQVQALFGVSVREALADPRAIVDLTHPDDIGPTSAVVAQAMQERAPVSIEFRIRSRSGREKWVQLVSQPAIDPLDGTEGRVGMLFDITARKAPEVALRENSTLWRRALESAGDGAWDWHFDTGEIELSASLKALYGFAPDAAMEGPRSLEALIHPDDLPGMRAALDAHLRGETPVFVHERRMRHADGRWLHILSRGMVLARDAAGRPLRMIGTHTDITARRQAEALRLERDAAAAADRAKTEFLSTVSHELRTPMNAVLGFAQLLEHEGLADARQRGWLQQIVASGRHLLALMDDILDLSSVQSGRLRLELEEVDLRPLLRQAWTMLEAPARAQQVQRLDDPSAAAWPVRADRRRLLQVLSNLLSNAIKYNRVGGHVRCAARIDDEPGGSRRLSLEIADSGMGMSADQLSRLFRPFERLGAQRSSVPGTGLGLAVSRGLVEAMGGTLTARSEPGVGSCFTLRLPLG